MERVGVNVVVKVGLMDIERYSVGLLIRRLRRGQGFRNMPDGKGRIFMKSSPHSFNNLVGIHHCPPCPQHLFKFDFARIELLGRHDEPDPEIVQDDDEMRQQPSHDPPDNREQGQGAADQEGGDRGGRRYGAKGVAVEHTSARTAQRGRRR